MKKIVIIVILVIAAFLGWKYFATKSTSTSTNNVVPSGPSIQIKDFKYNPKILTVKVGEKVIVTNMDISGHSVEADDGSFATSIISKNESATFTAPAKPGTFKFHCTQHPSIVGTLVVE